MKPTLFLAPLMFLTACGEAEPQQAQRISLDEARARPAAAMPSPDTADAGWAVTPNGQAIDFGQSGEPPLLTLECALKEAPARMTIVRHIAARPGLKALFPVLGNGMVSRFKVDTALHHGKWRWVGSLPATDPMLDVFTGPRDLEATLPGGGTLLIEGSRIPGEFVNWCRAGGRLQRAEAAEQAEAEEAAQEAGAPSSAPPVR